LGVRKQYPDATDAARGVRNANKNPADSPSRACDSRFGHVD
jgi:hypothetical protein